MHFSPADVSRFAAWSRDHNPLHVDPAFARGTFFGRSIVHGMCSAIHALADTRTPAGAGREVDIEFRGAVAPDATYPSSVTHEGAATIVTVHDPSGVTVLRLRASSGAADSTLGEVAAWASAVPKDASVRPTPSDLELNHITRLPTLLGRYRTDGPIGPGLEDSVVSPLHTQVYALCSYVVGMEVPGLRSLFTRATIRFSADVDAREELLYRVVVDRVDEAFRLLDTKVEVAGVDGRLVATCALRSYVRFSPVTTDLDQLRGQVTGACDLAALIVGGSRGLGADLAAALALAGARVFVNYHRDDAGAFGLRDRVGATGAALELLQGDAADPEWCSEAVSRIEAEAGGLDLLVLNACSAPTPLAIGVASATQALAYMQQNLALVQTPLAAALPALRRREGAIAYVSSSYVVDHPPKFGHYVALKQAGEAVVSTAVRELPELRALVLRPPPLQTAWNDTPSGAVGTIAADRVAVAFTHALGAATAGHSTILADFPALQRTSAHPMAPALNLALASSFTADPIEKSLRFWGGELALAPKVTFAPYSQILQALFDPASNLSTNSGGLNVVLLRVQDWLRELPVAQRDDVVFLRTHLQAAIRDLVDAMTGHRARARAATLLVLCPSSNSIDGSPAAQLLAEAEETLRVHLAGATGLQVLRATDFHDRYAVDATLVDDPLRDKIGHIPYTDQYFHMLGTVVLRQAWHRIAPPRKVVVVDCDNTLWRGVVGEVGAEALELGEEHLLLQDTLVELSRNGVVICLCSKNVEDDVWRVFESRTDMRLKREHIVSATINWRRKSENIRELASTLNLGLDSFVFLDDNHVECGEVRASCPEVLTLEWPHDPAAARRLLAHTWELDVQGATTEDRTRTQMYREELGRQQLRQGAGSFRDFLASLDLVVQVEPLAESDVARASQLTMRTNQFNFTTVRRDESEIRTLLESGRHDIRTVRVRDRFGDYGLVGLLIAERGDDELRADTFLMSCRVLGRGAEHRMMAEFGRIAQSYGLGSVHLRLDPTKRNAPARAFLETLAPDAMRGGDGVLDFPMPAATLVRLEYQPEDADPELPAADGVAQAVSATPGTDDQVGLRQRQREQQIARTAAALSSQADVAVAIDGRSTFSGTSDAPTASREQVSTTVLEAFSKSLEVTTGEVEAIDGLEALGCTSFRIVEITVSLMQSFAWLPNTLLFEHRAVSDIIDHISQLAEHRQSGAARTITPLPASDKPRRGPTSQDVAVIGMDLRCAGADSPEQLWALLSAGEVATRPVPARRRFFSAPLEDGRRHFAGLVDDVDQFDAAFFGISPREADLMDPQLRLFLQVAWGALEDAGAVAPTVDSDTGVFAGVMYDDYAHHANRLTRAAASPYKSWESFSLANRLSQVLGLRGPSMVIDTACSSSGTALHLACRAIVDGDCRAAIVGGVNLILDPDRFAQLGRLGILSTTGRCLAFGKEADGTVLGEGVGVVVLRGLEDAMARGDRIYGVIKGTGISTGSGTVGFTAPNPQAQAVAVRRAVEVSGVDPRTISYIETHGTATLLGDPIEVRGLTLGYGVEEGRGPERAGIGSIKPNIGHLEAGAAVLSLIKVLLQLHHRTLLPSVTSAEANPQIPFAQLPFSVQRRMEEWKSTGATPRRAAVSSFGVGGANVHVILEQAPESPTAAAAPGFERAAEIVTLSGRSAASLQEQARELAEWLEGHGEANLSDVSYTLNATRRHFEHRAAVVSESAAGLRTSLLSLSAGEPDTTTLRATLPAETKAPKIAFLFTGQGAQYHGMGRQLYATQPVFRAAVDACAAHLDPLMGVSLVELIHGEHGDAHHGRLDQTRFTQPALFAIEYALARLWQSWGVQPSVVVGHSVGEFAAMCIAGGLSLEDAARLVEARGRLMQALPAGGVMVSVAATEPRVREAMVGAGHGVAVAGVNSPQQTVISGEREAVDAVVVALTAAGIRTRALTVSHAFHSPLMQPMVEAFEAVVRAVTFLTPTVPIVSCVDGVLATDAMTIASYWTRQILEPVRFVQAMAALQQSGIGAYLEIGPQPVLTMLGRQCLGAESDAAAWVPSIKRDADEWETLLSSVGRLHLAGVQIDWRGVAAPATPSLVSLPRYAFDTRAHWVAASESSGAALPAASTRLSNVEAYTLDWVRVETPAPADAPGTWVILGANDAVAGDITRVLVNRGQQVVVIGTDAAAGRADIAAVLERHTPVRGVVHVRGLDAPGGVGMRVDELDSWRAQALDSAVAATQAVTSHAQVTRLYVVTRGAVAAGESDTAVALAQATLWGLGRTVALEHPDHWGGLIDLPGGPVGEDDVTAAVATLLAAGDEDQIAVRKGVCLAARLARRLRPRAARPSVSRDATYLITGGMGALGLQVAGWLADRGARHLVLVGRQVREATSLEELRRRGIEVQTAAVDIAVPAQVDALLESLSSSPYPLRGIVHAAGVDAQRPVAELTPDDLASALAAKMSGGWLLHERTRDSSIDFFICFSSLASVLGASGRAPYAAANAFLDALAHERRRLGLPALSVNWGPWSGAGMASEGETGQHFAAIGNHLIEPTEALSILESLLGHEEAQVVVADLDWTRFSAAYQSRRARPLISGLDGHAPVSPRPVGGAVAPGDVAQQVREEVAQVLGFRNAADVPLDRGFFEIGLDSLSSVELAARLEARFGVPCRGFVFDTPTVELLGERIARDVAARPGAGAPQHDGAATTSVTVGAAGGTVPRELGRYVPEMESALVVFTKDAFLPTRREDWILPRWRWMFEASARRFGSDPRVWVAMDGDRMTAHHGAIPVDLQVGGSTHRTEWLVETMVLDAYRSRALGVRLLEASLAEGGLALSLGQSDVMRTIQLKSGWQQAVALQTAQLLLRPERVLKGKLPAGAALGAGLGLRALSSLKRLGQSAPLATVRPIDRYDARHDALWDSMAREVGCAVVRDASYLNWKYVDQPGQDFFRYDAYDGERLLGTSVWMLREPDTAYRYRRAFLVDVVASLASADDLEAMIRAGCALMADEGADAVICWHAHDALSQALKRSGFSLREPGRVLLVYPGSLPASAAAQVSDGTQWLLTQGDSDIDRPW